VSTKKLLSLIVIIFICNQPAYAGLKYHRVLWSHIPLPSVQCKNLSKYVKSLCINEPENYSCVKVEQIYNTRGKSVKSASWEDVFREDYRDFQRVNRRNTIIWKGHCLVLPNKLSVEKFNHTPFPKEDAVLTNHILVDLNVLAWGAYKYGTLVHWGMANGGSKRCTDSGKLTCKTHPGTWKIIRKGGYITKSQLYPLDCSNKKKCGFPMYYFQQFHADGTGLHGAKNLPGYNASHGCVRLTKEDSWYLNKVFTNQKTLIIIKDY